MHLHGHSSIFEGIICAGYELKNLMTNQTSIDVGEALLTSRGHGMNWAELTFMAPGNKAGTFNLT